MWKFALVILAVACQGAFSHSALPKAQQNLANSILKSSRTIEDSPQRSLECFSIYLPKINEATNNYEVEYAKCLDTAANATAAIEAEVAQDRASVSYDADGICTMFQECSQTESSVDFFQCYFDSSEEAITKSYGIQTLAKNRMQFISLKYQTITYDQKMCTDGCSDAYVRETSALYAQLDACLAGEVITISPNEPESTTTVEPETTEATPDIPTPPQSDI